MKHLDQATALAIVPYLCHQHCSEILRTHETLEAWAIERAALNGVSYAVEDRHGPILIGGVIDRGPSGYLWFAGAAGWERKLRHLVRVFREIRASRVYRYLECEAFADNEDAQHFIERLGFQRLKVRGTLVYYGMAL